MPDTSEQSEAQGPLHSPPTIDAAELAWLSPGATAVLSIDMWNDHWCTTAAQRVRALVPRMNAAFGGLRALGIPIIWAPTTGASGHEQSPARHAARNAALIPVPDVDAPPLPPSSPQGCMCGITERCAHGRVWTGLHPDLHIADQDLIVDGRDELYANLAARGIGRLVYTGVHANACVLDKPEGMRSMRRAGIDCWLARDLTDANRAYDPATGHTPDDATRAFVAELGEAGVPLVDLVDAVQRALDEPAPDGADPVRITPWGTEARPSRMPAEMPIALTHPALGDGEIRYTVDGSAPSPRSRLYTGPFAPRGAHIIRAAAFRDGQALGPESRSWLAA